jgi:hypothetical protein
VTAVQGGMKVTDKSHLRKMGGGTGLSPVNRNGKGTLSVAQKGPGGELEV